MIYVVRLLILYMLVQIAVTKLTILWGKRQTIMMILQRQWIWRLVKAWYAYIFAEKVYTKTPFGGTFATMKHNNWLARLVEPFGIELFLLLQQ